MKKIIVGLMLVVSVASVSVALDTPVMTFAKNKGACADIRWTAGAGTEGFIIYRSTYPSGLNAIMTYPYTNVFIGNPDLAKNVSIVSVTTNTISLSWSAGLTNATSYYFRIRAYAGSVQSGVSNQKIIYVPSRAISGYVIWDGDPATCVFYATLPSDAVSHTLTGLNKNSAYSYKVSALSAFDATGYGTIAPLSPANYVSTTTLGCVLSNPHSVSLSVQPHISSVTVAVSVEGYNGYGGAGYYRFAHSINPVITDDDFTNGITDSVTSLVDSGWKFDAEYTEGATNYYAIKIVDYNPDVTMISDTKSCYMMSYDVDHFVVSVASSVVAGTSFPVIVTGKNAENVTVPFNLSDSAVILPILASDESLTGSDVLRVTAIKTYEGNSTVLHYAYTKAEDIKIKITNNGQSAISNMLTIMPGALVDMNVETSPSSIISGQSSDITSYLWDIYRNHIKSIKIQFKVNKGKGKLDKDEDTTDVTGKVKIKFFHDDITPGINMIKITALHLTQDVQINVAVLIYGKKGGTIVASEDPNTQIIMSPEAVTEDVQLSIKIGDELSDATKDKVNNANGKEKNICENSVREFECKKDDGSDYGNFNDLVTIEIPYKDDDNDDVVDGTNIKVDDIKVCRLNETDERWDSVEDGGYNKIDRERKCVRAQVRHFSTYNIGERATVNDTEPIVIQDLSMLRIYPNPINFSKAIRNTLKFGNLPQNTKIEIYNITGGLVRSINSIDTNNVEWNGKNESGESIGMGLYVYLLTDVNGNKKIGKIGVQK